MNHHYRTLEISPGSSLEEIKKAYRRLAMKYHPDRNPNSEDKFKQINEAYESLVKAFSSRSQSQAFQGGLDSMFAEMLKRMKRPQNYRQVIRLKLSIREALEGAVKNLNVLMDIPCQKCSIFTRNTCTNCRGEGFVRKSKRHSGPRRYNPGQALC